MGVVKDDIMQNKTTHKTYIDTRSINKFGLVAFCLSIATFSV